MHPVCGNVLRVVIVLCWQRALGVSGELVQLPLLGAGPARPRAAALLARSPTDCNTPRTHRAPAHYSASAEGMRSNNWEILSRVMSHFKEMFERETFSNLDIAFLVRLFHKKHNWCCDIFNTYKYLVHVCIIFVLYIMKSIVARISDLVMQLNSNRNFVCFEHTDPVLFYIFI